MRFQISFAAALLLAATSSFASEQSPFADKTAASYSSYNDDKGHPVEIPWGDLKANDFGSRKIEFDVTGVRPLHQIPAPGVHPRIFFTPDDLPDIRRRLKETQCGQAVWKNILCWTEMMKGNYDDKAQYAQPDVWKGSFGGLHGRVPLFRLGVNGSHGYNHNQAARERYQKLIAGDMTQEVGFYWNVFALEAFRCLIENDQNGAKDLAKAVVTSMKIDQAKRAADPKVKRAGEPPDQPVGAFQLAYVYDLINQWLTPEQHKAIHDELALGSWHHDNYGTFNEATASRSNWATFSYWLIEVLSIEDEPGFNDLKVRGMYRGWRDLLTYGWFQSGATYEGEAKNQLGMDGIIPFAMRTKRYGFENLCGHPYLRAYADKFLPQSIIPTLDGFVKYDLLGGSRTKAGGFTPCDLVGLKYMFPQDKTIDWVYRCTVGEDYHNVPDRCDGYYNGLLFFAIFASDYDASNNNPAKLDLGNTFFCGERSLMMTRSGWDSKDALMLNLHVRQANGGHPYADRNSIMLTGAGRVWSPIEGSRAFENFKNSVIVIDGKPQEVSVPGRMVDFQDSPMATFAVGDAKYCWDWNWRVLNKRHGYYTVADVTANRVEIPPGWQPETHTTNDFAYLKLPYAYLNVPFFQRPDWILPAGAISPVVRQPNYPVRRAFRTAGIIRGPHPYALVVDDYQRDDSPAHYDWNLTLEPDIQIISMKKTGEREMDILLSGSNPDQNQPPAKEPLPAKAASDAIPAGQPVLLVRVLNRNDQKDADPTIADVSTDPKTKDGAVRRLVIPADAVSPDFKILLCPYRQGEAVPRTAWADSQHTMLNVALGDAKDTITFAPGRSGKTDLSIAREEGGRQTVLLNVNQPIEPLKDDAPGPAPAARQPRQN